jgi:hypothetical protein
MQPSRLTLALLLSIAAPHAAAQVTLSADEVLRVHFITTPPFNTPQDVLSLHFGIITVNQAFTTRTADLYDCGVLLASHSDSLFGNHVGQLSLSPSNTFRTAASPYTFLNPAVADFTSIASGAIQGVINFHIATGMVTFPSLSQVNLRMIRATGGSGGSVTSPSPVITSIEIAPKMTLSPGTVNATNTLSVTGAVPGSTVFFGFGTICAQLPLPCAGSPRFDILNPFAFVPVFADPSGFAATSFFVPSGTSGLTFMLQAIELDTCLRSSNLIPHTF